MTKGDLIRHASNEELAKWLVNVQIDTVMDVFKINPHFGNINPPDDETKQSMRENILKLLQEEVRQDG